MSVCFLKHVALEIPEEDIEKAKRFYTDFGLQAVQRKSCLAFKCYDRRYDSVLLIPGAKRKRLHHVCMGTTSEGIDKIWSNANRHDIPLIDGSPTGSSEGFYMKSPDGVLFHIVEAEKEEPILPEPPFLINSPGQNGRINAQALPFKSTIPEVKPRSMGHIALFSEDVDSNVEFLELILGMRLSDKSQDVVAFLHCQGGSEHHVIAFTKSHGPGFHHCSFLVGSPDEVGLGGRRMIEKGNDYGWGFGRHAIGSNFFHYIRDPWGSYAEYYCDMDYITNTEQWTPKNWPLEDATHSWGPNPPDEFINNFEVD